MVTMRWYTLDGCGPDTFSALADGFVPMAHQFDDSQSWSAGLTGQESGAYKLLHWDQRGIRRCRRTHRHIRATPGDDFYWVIMPDRGDFSLRFQDAVTAIGPGKAMVAGLERPCHLEVPTSAAYAFQVPRTEFEHRARPRAHMSTVLDMRRGLGGIAGNMLRHVHAERSELPEREFNAVCDRVTELLCMMMLGETHPQHEHHMAVAESIRRYLRANIGRADVRLPAVAHALGWSPRQLRTVLGEFGTTFRDVRREEAFRVARDLLSDPRSTLSITELAIRCGFTPTWFSSAFKERFGMSPREYRQHRRAGTGRE
ncbi:MAG: AraC family transcriptional regulator [Nocardia sp.]|nr:AraC family transcriptional regulator [Nocardia sp.]NUS93624.1 AraC family transcriptional regulator [Nocardia sp.]